MLGRLKPHLATLIGGLRFAGGGDGGVRATGGGVGRRRGLDGGNGRVYTSSDWAAGSWPPCDTPRLNRCRNWQQFTEG